MTRRDDRRERLRRLETLRVESPIDADVVLDAIGLYCPVPVMLTAEKIATMRPGEVLEVHADDRVVLLDMPAWCLSTGHTYLGSLEETEHWRLYVRRR